MDKEQYYLQLIAEECAEIIQVCSKAARFGIDNYPPKQPDITNRIRLKEEVNDLLAVLQLLQVECNINTELDPELVHKKINKVGKYTKLSWSLNKVCL